MDIYFATVNDGKVNTLRTDLEKRGISVIKYPADFIEPRSSDVREIAESKIMQAYPSIKKPTIVIDAGFYIESLNSFPKAFVNFALETIGINGILKLVENKPRECEFIECLAYMDTELDEPKYFMTYVKGTLAKEERGVMQPHLWSKLGLVFIPNGSQKTLAEMNSDEFTEWRLNFRDKHSLATQLCDWLENQNK